MKEYMVKEKEEEWGGERETEMKRYVLLVSLSPLPPLPSTANPNKLIQHSAIWHSTSLAVCLLLCMSAAGPESGTRPHYSEGPPAGFICFSIISNLFLMYTLQRPKFIYKRPTHVMGNFITSNFFYSNDFCNKYLYSFSTISWF